MVTERTKRILISRNVTWLFYTKTREIEFDKQFCPPSGLARSKYHKARDGSGTVQRNHIDTKKTGYHACKDQIKIAILGHLLTTHSGQPKIWNCLDNFAPFFIDGSTNHAIFLLHFQHFVMRFFVNLFHTIM